MNGYISSVMAVTIGCHLLLLIVSELGGEGMQKLLRFVCGLVLLLTLFSPLVGLMTNLEAKLPDIGRIVETEASLAEQREEAILSGTYAYAADAWIRMLSEECDIAPEKITITFHTNNEGKLTEAEVLLTRCPYSKRQKAEKRLLEAVDIPVVVKGE